MTLLYRKGPMGAMTDLYEREITDLNHLLKDVDEVLFIKTINEQAESDFHSIRNIMEHVIRSGFSYANYIRKRFGHNYFIPTVQINTPEEAIIQTGQMFRYTLETFEDKWHLTDEDLMNTIIKTTWSMYDMEGIIEHAIVHILRHSLQIEKMILKNESL